MKVLVILSIFAFVSCEAFSAHHHAKKHHHQVRDGELPTETAPPSDSSEPETLPPTDTPIKPISVCPSCETICLGLSTETTPEAKRHSNIHKKSHHKKHHSKRDGDFDIMTCPPCDCEKIPTSEQPLEEPTQAPVGDKRHKARSHHVKHHVSKKHHH